MPCGLHKVNMLWTYYMISSVLEPSTSFSVLHDNVTVTVIGITLPSLSVTVVTVTWNTKKLLYWAWQCYSAFMELLLFLIMLFFVETVMLERTCVAVCLMVPFAVYALEGMGTVLSLLHFKPWSISLQVFSS